MRLRSAGSGLKRRDRVVGVVGPRQQRGQLETFEVLLELVDRAGELDRELGVILLFEQLVERAGILDARGQGVVPMDLGLQPGESLRYLLAACGVVPERRVGGFPLELGG